MSRPHDGQRPFFPSGNPFRSIFHRGHYASHKLAMLLNSFEEKLAETLRKIEPKDESNVTSLSWMKLALESLCETHSDIKTLITELQFPVSDWEEKWIDVYLDNSVKLLDICIAFSSELSRLSQSKLMLQYVLHVLESSDNISSSEQLKHVQSSLHKDWIEQIWSRNCKLENCTSIINELVRSLYPSNIKSAKGKVLMQGVYGVMVKTILLCSAFTAAFTGSTKPLVDLQVPEKFIWSEAFNNLQEKINGQVRRFSGSSSGLILEELRATHCQVEKLYSSISGGGTKETEILKECISDLGESSTKLSEGLGLLSKKVEEFFQIVLKGRDTLLGKLRESDPLENNTEQLFLG